MTTMAKLTKALFKRIRATSDLMEMITGVFDSVPEGQKMPYIVLTDITEEPEYLLANEVKWDTDITLYIWSESSNSLEELDILEQLELAIETPLEIEGYRVSHRLRKSTTERQSNYLRYMPIHISFKVETE